MNIHKTIFLLLFISARAFAQYDNNWVLGQGSLGWGNNYLQFNGINSPVISISAGVVPMFSANTVISNNNGNLVAFTNGINIYDASFNIMQGGSNLNPSPLTAVYQSIGSILTGSAVFLPLPTSSDLYYLFHLTGNYSAVQGGIAGWWPDKLYYSIIDASLNGGLGSVTSINNVLLNDSLEGGGISAVRHANGRDWWIIFKKYNDNLFYSYLFTTSGIVGPYTQHIGSNSITWGSSQAVFSQDGEWYIFMGQNNEAELFHFDRCSGILSNYNHLFFSDSSTSFSIGVAFSSSNRFLYTLTEFAINQFDLASTNINSSRKVVAVYDGFVSPLPTNFGISKLAPDDKIYVSSYNGCPFLSVINYPDSIDTLCNVTQHSIQLLQPNASSIPVYPNYNLGRLIGSSCDTITGLNENSTSPISISISPNPATDFFWINYDLSNQPGNAELIIYNTLGEMVLRKTLYNYFKTSKIDCSGFADGVYYLSVVSNQQKIASAKFVKQ